MMQCLDVPCPAFQMEEIVLRLSSKVKTKDGYR
jgi:hypothetical protein